MDPHGSKKTAPCMKHGSLSRSQRLRTNRGEGGRLGPQQSVLPSQGLLLRHRRSPKRDNQTCRTSTKRPDGGKRLWVGTDALTSIPSLRLGLRSASVSQTHADAIVTLSSAFERQSSPPRSVIGQLPQQETAPRAANSAYSPKTARVHSDEGAGRNHTHNRQPYWS